MSVRKAKQARKNNGGVKSNRKVVNPVLNGELLAKLEQFAWDATPQGSVYGALIFLEDGEVSGMAATDTTVPDFVRDNVSPALLSFFTRSVGTALPLGTIFGFTFTTEGFIIALKETVRALMHTPQPVEGWFGAAWDDYECTASFFVDPFSSTCGIQYETENRAPFNLHDSGDNLLHQVLRVIAEVTD